MVNNRIYLIDTYAWIEYLLGTRKGEKLRNLFIDNQIKFITLDSTLAEVYNHCLKDNINFEKVYEIIKINSVIFPVLKEHWLNASKIRYDLRKKITDFGMIDAILVARQYELKCKIITGDTHFRNLPNIDFID